MVVGVISDTHNHLYREVKELLEGVDHIVHAGDICVPQLLAELRGIAPVTAVRGNCDLGSWAGALPSRAEFELGGTRILVAHMLGHLRERPADGVTGRRADAVQPHTRVNVAIFGHSHQPSVERKDGVLYLNPGSAGPRRYGRPRTMAFLNIPGSLVSCMACKPEQVSAEIVVVEG